MVKADRQSLGNRRSGSKALPLDQDARTVVRWLYRHRTQNRAEISRITGLPRDFTQRWAPRPSNDVQWKGTKRTGRPKIIPDSELPALKAQVQDKRFASARRVRHKYRNPRTGTAVATNTVIARLRDAGLKAVRVRRTCFLTAAHREARIWFAELYRHEDWQRWIFTDEKRFLIGGIKGNEKMWVEMSDPDPEARYVGRVSHPTKVMVWGAVSYTGKSSLHFFDEKVDSEEFKRYSIIRVGGFLG
jgi:hypothetical protein